MERKHFLDIPSHPMGHFFSNNSLFTKNKTTVLVSMSFSFIRLNQVRNNLFLFYKWLTKVKYDELDNNKITKYKIK
jgi:hypothetical protein